jgi:hypothetical protein
VEEHYFNIVSGEWSLSASETMSDKHEIISENLKITIMRRILTIMTDNYDKMTNTNNKMTDNSDKMVYNPEKLITILTRPGLSEPEQGLGGEKYVVGLSIRKPKVGINCE